MGKKLLYSIVIDASGYLPALIAWLMAKNISFGLAQKDLKLLTFVWLTIGAILIFAFYKSRIGIFGGLVQIIQGVLKSFNIISLSTPMPVATATWLITGCYNVIQAVTSSARNFQRKRENRRQQKRYEYQEKSSKRPKHKKTFLAWFIFLLPFFFLYEHIACLIFNETGVNDATSYVATALYNGLVIFLLIWYLKFKMKQMRNDKNRDSKFSSISTITNILDWFKTIRFGKIILYGGLLIVINVFNLLSPIFNFITDQDIIFVDPIVKIFTDKKERAENMLVARGQRWNPPMSGGNLSTWVIQAAEQEDIPLWVLAGVVSQESGGGRLAIPPGRRGEIAAGPLQYQSPHGGEDMRVTGRSQHFMDGDKYSSTLEWKRTRHLAMICGLQIGSPLPDYFLDWIKYFVVSSIDDRLSKKAVFKAAKTLKKRYEKLKEKHAQSDETELWRAAIATWPFGEGKKAWNNRNSSLINLYVDKGRAYAAKYGS
ncbi:MAG TPA: hypothetical protein PLK76_01885 [bacterium]|nr:hypothetical protein [bacterium]